MYIGRCQASIWCCSNCKPSCRCVRSIVMLWRLELLLAYGSNSQGVSDSGIRQTGVLIMGELLLIIDAHYNQRLCCSHYSHCWVKCIYTRRVESSTGTNIQACGVPNNAEETHSCSCYWCRQYSMTKLPGHKHNNTSTMTTTKPFTYKHVWAYKLGVLINI